MQIVAAHELIVQVGALASIGSATQAPAEHTGVEPEQPLQAVPPVPHVAVDWPPRQLPLLQQPPQFEVEHTGAASGAASCTPPPSSGVVEVPSGVSSPSTGSPS